MRAALLMTLALLAVAQAAGPTVLTKANFNDMVFNSGKSAFVKFFAPWCGPAPSVWGVFPPWKH